MLIDLRRILCMTTLAALGHIHGHIGTPQQGRDIEAVFRGERNANASSYREGMVIDQERGIERAKEGTRSIYRSAGICCWKHDGKLVSSQPGNEIGGAQATLQACTDLL